MKSGLERRDYGDRTEWRVVITNRDWVAMEQEQTEMLGDAIWLIQQALAGRPEGRISTSQPLPARRES